MTLATILPAKTNGENAAKKRLNNSWRIF